MKVHDQTWVTRRRIGEGWLHWFAAIGVGLGLTGCVGGDAPEDPYATQQGAGGQGGQGDQGDQGGEGGSTDAGSGKGSQLQAGAKDSHYPLVDGATWTYHHEYPQNPAKMPWDEVATMSATTYMDEPAFLLEDEEDAQGERSASTMLAVGTRVLRVFKQVDVAGQVAFSTTYDPGFLRYDEALLETDDFLELSYDSTQTCVMASTASKCAPGAVRMETTTHTYKVISMHSEVTVEAGTFDTIEIERTNLGDPTIDGDEETKRYWYAAGVGKIREEDQQTFATEELTTYVIP